MGVDLTLLPFEARDTEWAIGHTMLDCNRDSALFEAIMAAVKPHEYPVPRYFATFRSREGGADSHYSDTQETPYGERLTWVHAQVLLPFADDPAVRDDWQNRAVWAYLKELPPDLSIALFWH